MKLLVDNNDKYVNLIETLSDKVINVDNPSRYFPSEYFHGNKEYTSGMIKAAVCFPDLYEIGMANNAIKIIYDILNRDESVYCDRVFSVKPDFEELLLKENIKLFTLKDHFKVNTLDLLAVAISYELSCTCLLQVLKLSGMALRAEDRLDTDPIVILGGPAITNPLPFSPFCDFVHIGEAEEDMQDIIDIFKKFKSRKERISQLKNLPHLWYKSKEKTTRAVDYAFGTEKEDPIFKYYVVPAFNISQDHGTVEIMRGCPNGCRFCHAGQYYKPYRQRSVSTITKLVDQCVNDFGYKEITLSSLSSGDYPNLDTLIKILNTKYKDKNISFSLPSLRVSSFSLNILDQLSEVRKSGLTFAIETPLEDDQKALNKDVCLNSVISILKEAKSRGWRSAKFYFMIGLPYTDQENEVENIVSYISEIYKSVKINIHVNIGTFIPKSHTAFQWSRQLSISESKERLKTLKNALIRSVPGIKVSYHEPAISYLEGLFSRGDEKYADLAEYVFNKGERLTAWDEYLDYSIWEEGLSKLNIKADDIDSLLKKNLPWNDISLNVSKNYFIDEKIKAENKILTEICSESCNIKCGVCNKNHGVLNAISTDEKDTGQTVKNYTDYKQVIISYSKKGRAVFNSHIAVLRQFEMAFLRANIPVLFTQGFNPKPKMEFANPLAMGICGDNEYMLCELPLDFINNQTVIKLNDKISDGFIIKDIMQVKDNATGKKISLASNMLCSVFEISDINDENIKNYLLKQTESSNNITVKDDIFTIKTNGEENIFKNYFPAEFTKFQIISSSKITRKSIQLNQSVIKH